MANVTGRADGDVELLVGDEKRAGPVAATGGEIDDLAPAGSSWSLGVVIIDGDGVGFGNEKLMVGKSQAVGAIEVGKEGNLTVGLAVGVGVGEGDDGARGGQGDEEVAGGVEDEVPGACKILGEGGDGETRRKR